MARPPKKSETIEIRLPHADKTAFAARCQAEGRTVSEAVRGFIEDQLKSGAASKPILSWRLIAAAVAGLVVGGVAAPTLARPILARPATDARAVFDRLDRNHDGVLSFEEFSRR